MSISTVQTWLERYSEQMKYCGRLEEHLDRLRTRAGSAGSSKLSGMPGSPNRPNDTVGALLAQIEGVEQELAEAIEESEQLRREIETGIKRITGTRWPDLRAVLRFRYIQGMKWGDVNDALYGAEVDFLDREESYRHRVMMLHREALDRLSAILGADIEKS